MGKGSILSVEQIIKKTAVETVKELEKARLTKQDGATFFQKTEKLLYNYNDLQEAVKQKERDIEFLQINGLQGKSKSIVLYSTNPGSAGADQYVEVLEAYRAAKERTERLISKIDRALNEIKQDPKYFIIQEKYFSDEKHSNEKIAEKFGINEKTVRRHRNRLINKLQILLFGADALDILD